MGKPLLSIVIPTKNRYKYLVGSLESFLLLNRDDFEVIVQDNSDDNSFIKDYLGNHPEYSFVRYYHSGEHLSMSDNSDLAISHSSGEFVCFLGDDDSITDKIFDVIDYMAKNNCDSCFGRINRFNWKDYMDIHPGAEKYRSYKTVTKYEVLNTEDILKTISKIGAIEMKNLPRVYHGVVRRILLDVVKDKTGTYFPGPSPDMASATAIAVFAKKHVQTNIPIIISGFSYNSGGGQGKGGHHRGEISKVGFLPSNIMEIWDNRIPKFFSGLTIWPVTFIYALTKCGRKDIVEQMNFNHIYANLYISHPDLMRTHECEYVNKMKVYPLILTNFASRVFLFLKRKLFPSSGVADFTLVSNVDSLSDALLYEINNNKYNGM